MSVDALSIANYFIEKSFHEPSQTEPLTPMKVLKMIYLAHGLYLGDNNEPLIKQHIMAWRYGPVIDDVYQAFKKYGNKKITALATDAKGHAYCIEKTKKNERIIDLLDQVWVSCLNYTAIQLSNWSHEKNSPWDITYNEKPLGSLGKRKIDNQIIRDYFSREF